MTKRHGAPQRDRPAPGTGSPRPIALLLAAAGVLVAMGVTFVVVQVITRVLPAATER